MSSFGGARPKTTSSSRSSRGAAPLEEEETEGDGNLDEDYVYMYCGGGDLVIADLPKSLYELHLTNSHASHHLPPLSPRSSPPPPPPVHHQQPSPVAQEQDSPDMDFLEMDFDENVSESPSVSLNLDEDETGGLSEEEEEPLPPLRSAPPPPPPPPPPPLQPCPSLSPSATRSRSLNSPHIESKAAMCADARGKSDPGAHPVDEVVSLNKLSQKETNSSNDSDPSSEDNEDPLELTMIWTEEEVKTKATWSIETASTGPIAVMNVLRALNYNPEREDIVNHFNSVRASEQTEECPSSPLPDPENLSEEPKGLASYLFSCCMNSPDHKDLISVVNLYTKGKVVSRFFSTYPRRKFTPSLSKWLIHWIQKGAIPVATINLREEKELFPGSWHYLMIFGVGPTGIYVTNPIVCAPEKFFMRYLSYPSEMVVDKSDILKRWHHETDLTPLRDIKDDRWRELNVLGQVIHTLREECQKQPLGGTAPECIRIPCNHKCGITLFMNQDSEHVSELLNSHELSEISSPRHVELSSFSLHPR